MAARTHPSAHCKPTSACQRAGIAVRSGAEQLLAIDEKPLWPHQEEAALVHIIRGPDQVVRAVLCSQWTGGGALCRAAVAVQLVCRPGSTTRLC